MRDVSDLEREYELELEGDAPRGDIEREYEALVEDDREADEDHEAEPGSYAERFYELSQREYESEAEVDEKLGEVLEEMARDRFFGKLLKSAGGVARRLAKKGARYALQQIPAFQAVSGVTQLLKGNLGDSLKRIAKAGLMSAVPGAAVALPALQALGFGGDGNQREAWERFSEFAGEVYEQAADAVTEEIDNPAVASLVANKAVQAAYERVYQRPRTTSRSRSHDGRREIALRPGEALVIRGR